jgi:type I restriction enzyme, S subunit
MAESLMAHQRHNEMENETLAQTRDLLLPRLMSGELRLADLHASEKETAA